jgi:hypothetical protein
MVPTEGVLALVGCACLKVLESLSICLEDSLTGRFNRLLQHRAAPHLTSLSIFMAPDDVEHSRMQVLQLLGLPLLKLSLHHSADLPSLPGIPIRATPPGLLVFVQCATASRIPMVPWLAVGFMIHVSVFA